MGRKRRKNKKMRSLGTYKDGNERIQELLMILLLLRARAGLVCRPDKERREKHETRSLHGRLLSVPRCVYCFPPSVAPLV